MTCYNNFIINGLKVPCMYCLACRINKISSWTVRILGEMAKNPKNCFLTLTYNEENLQFEDSIATLRKRHIQLFHKRLRKTLSEQDIKIKYFACGEYGENYNRPHYHGIYIGMSIADAKLINIVDIWGKGNVHFGTVTPASIRYVLGYIMDKKAGDDYEPAEPPFQISSNLFGSEWIDENFEKLCREGVFTYKGKKIVIPKFIRDYYEIPGIGQLGTNLKKIQENKPTGLTPYELMLYIKNKEVNKQEWTKKTLEKKEELYGKRQTERF